MTTRHLAARTWVGAGSRLGSGPAELTIFHFPRHKTDLTPSQVSSALSRPLQLPSYLFSLLVWLPVPDSLQRPWLPLQGWAGSSDRRGH